MKRTVHLAIGAVILCGSSALAHHGSSWFDKNNQLTITGVITEVDWVNPHTSLEACITNINFGESRHEDRALDIARFKELDGWRMCFWL